VAAPPRAAARALGDIATRRLRYLPAPCQLRHRTTSLLTSSATSFRVAARLRAAAVAAPPRVAARHCTPLNVDAHPYRRLAGTASNTSWLVAAIPPAVKSCNDVIIYNFYSYYTPFQSARQPSEIANSPTHIFN